MRYFFIAGEASGDQHASRLMDALRHHDEEAEFQFLGGDAMSEFAGDPVIHIDEMAFMGFMQLIKHLGKIRRNFKEARKAILDFAPDVLILVDYAGFNLRMAKWAKKSGFRVYYYIPPKVWAWNTKRVYKLKEYTDKVFPILPFEESFLKRFDLDVTYIGNPVYEEICSLYPDSFKKDRDDSRIIALLPGSRKQEIERVLPVMLEIVDSFEHYTFVIAGMEVHNQLYSKYIDDRKNVELSFRGTLAVLNESVAALVTSGTATLETALMAVPQIVCYKTNNLSYHIAKWLIKVPYISLVNLILHRQAVPELVQSDCTDKQMVENLTMILPGGANRHDQLEIYHQLGSKIGSVNPSDNLAILIISSLSMSLSDEIFS